jgi:hypothetical protein
VRNAPRPEKEKQIHAA